MLKIFFTTTFLIALFTTVRSENFNEYTQCEWISEVLPEASFKQKKHVEGLARSLRRADLIYKDKVIKSIVYGKTLGYGIEYWNLEGGISREYGRVNIDKRGGGRLVFFVSDKNIPLRSFINYSERHKIKPKKVLLVGLGSLLYRTKIMEDIRNRGLKEAVEGYWVMNDKCYHPR